MLLTQVLLKRGLNPAVLRATTSNSSAMFRTPTMIVSALPKFHLSSDNRTGGADEASHDDFQPKSKTTGAEGEITDHISKWIEENDVCIFMKGTRKMPQCGFSRYVVVLMNAYGVKQYKDVNVLSDNNLRSAIKVYSNWPTIPQVYIKGEFVGGCDIMKEMHEDGSLRELLLSENIIKE